MDREKRDLPGIRFPDGERIGPLVRDRRPISSIGIVALVIIFVLAVIGTLLLTQPAISAETEIIFEVADECAIDNSLRVTGTKRAACVERLATATRLAKAEMLVNERLRRK